MQSNNRAELENWGPVQKIKLIIRANAVIQIILGRGEDVRQQVISQPEQTSSPLMCLFFLKALPCGGAASLSDPPPPPLRLILQSPATGRRTEEALSRRGATERPHRRSTGVVRWGWGVMDRLTQNAFSGATDAKGGKQGLITP